MPSLPLKLDLYDISLNLFIQCMRCWIWYETRQFGIWGSLSGLCIHLQTQHWRHSKIDGQGWLERSVYLCLCVCECVRKVHERVTALVLWQYSALVGITHEQTSNGTTWIFPFHCLKRLLTASGHLWKLFYLLPLPHTHFLFCPVPVASFKLYCITVQMWHLKRMIASI